MQTYLYSSSFLAEVITLHSFPFIIYNTSGNVEYCGVVQVRLADYQRLIAALC